MQHLGTHIYLPGYETKPYLELVNRFIGGHFAYNNTNVVDFLVDGEDKSGAGKIYVVVGDTDGNKQLISFAEDKQIDLRVSGPYGLHNSFFPVGAIASTVYVIYAAWNSFTNPDEDLDYVSTNDDAFEGCIFCVPSGTVITPVMIGLLTGNFDSWSRPLGFVVNDAGSDIVTFYSVDRKTVRFHEADLGLIALTNGVAEASTKIDLRPFVPEEAARFRIYLNATQTDDNPTPSCTLNIDDGAAEQDVYTTSLLGAIAGLSSYNNAIFDVDIIHGPMNDLLGYIWSATPTGGLDVYVQAVTMFE